MTCHEFERVLPTIESVESFEQEEHLRTCAHCSNLVAELNAIIREASSLRASEEPSPRVWNSIEIALREEGLIHEPLSPQRRLAVRAGWRLAWLAPVAAALLVGTGLLVHQQQAKHASAGTLAMNARAAQGPDSAASADEDQLLKIVAARGPAFRAAYQSDLQAVDSYIKDAQRSAQDDPNDEIAQQSLMNAYEQKAMVYELAMERSQP